LHICGFTNPIHLIRNIIFIPEILNVVVHLLRLLPLGGVSGPNSWFPECSRMVKEIYFSGRHNLCY